MKLMSAEASRAFTRKVILPLAALVAALLVCAVGGVFLIAEYQTDVAIRQEATLARSALTMLSDRLKAGATDYGRWDEALAAAVDKFDFRWLSKNIGEAGETSFGAEALFVLDADGHTVYSRVDSTDGKVPIETVLPPEFKGWYHKWRTTPAYATLANIVPFGESSAAAFAIAPLRPFEESDKRPPTWYSLVFVDVIDKPALEKLQADFHLANFRLITKQADIGDKRAVIRALSADGAERLQFTWDPKRPGDELLKVAIPFLVMFVVVMGALGAVLLRYVVVSVQIITDREQRAFSDPLTALANRAGFAALLDKALRRIAPGQGVTVMYIDLDGFKHVNDTMGHAAGDELLAIAASRFKTCLRAGDVVARLGGDEFAVLIVGGNERSYIQAVGVRILLALAEPFQLAAGTAQVSCSIGISECWDHSVTGADLLNRADRALYEAKAAGKNALRFHGDVPAAPQELRVA
jgi:diguanylate cyclase (GGDEF)-like protein